jgi:hypothetical protein
MISSNYYEVRILRQGEPWSVRADALALPWIGTAPLPVDAEESFAVAIHTTAPNPSRLRVRLANEVIADVAAGTRAFETPQEPWLRNEFGESCLAIEQETELFGADGEPGAFVLIFELGLEVRPRPEVARDFRVMIEEVAAIHEGLAQDIIHRAFLKKRLQAGPVERLPPEAVLHTLQDLWGRLEKAVADIARQPSVMLDRSSRLARYRGGDRVDAAALSSVARDPQNTRRDAAGRVTALGKVRTRVPVVSDDLPEHRHIADGIRQLARRAEKLARHCERKAELINREKERWGQTRGRDVSVFEQHYLPRVAALEKVIGEARRLGEFFGELVHRHAFLRNAGPPRTVLGPTPIFLGRTAYREVYRTLMRAQRPLGVLVDGDTVRLAYRNLATLYEYWCFLQTITYLRQRLGAPGPWTSLGLVDENYRPDLASGQEFHWVLDPDRSVVATYEPEIRPWRTALQHGDRYGACLTRDPLRPDITIEIRSRAEPGVMLVLDAKSTDHFTFDKFRDVADYARQVFEPRSWRQPVRQVFLLHRDRQRVNQPVTNVPHYLEGRQVEPDVALFGAVACLPEQVHHIPEALANVIDRFLETHSNTL